eukprot:4706278-Amphidinium_carterae.1
MLHTIQSCLRLLAWLATVAFVGFGLGCVLVQVVGVRGLVTKYITSAGIGTQSAVNLGSSVLKEGRDWQRGNVTPEMDLVTGFWAQAHELNATQRAHKATPLFWAHIPKTGSNFAWLILSNPAFCTGTLSDESWPDAASLGRIHRCPGTRARCRLCFVAVPSRKLSSDTLERNSSGMAVQL